MVDELKLKRKLFCQEKAVEMINAIPDSLGLAEFIESALARDYSVMEYAETEYIMKLVENLLLNFKIPEDKLINTWKCPVCDELAYYGKLCPKCKSKQKFQGEDTVKGIGISEIANAHTTEDDD